jgi:hypothetical protein
MTTLVVLRHVQLAWVNFNFLTVQAVTMFTLAFPVALNVF